MVLWAMEYLRWAYMYYFEKSVETYWSRIHVSLNWTIHEREIQLFCYITNSRIESWRMKMPVTWSILGIKSYDAIFSNVWYCLPVNYLLSSSLCNWFRLVPDWYKPVLHNAYCFIIAWEKMIFSSCLSILIQNETNIVLKNSLH